MRGRSLVVGLGLVLAGCASASTPFSSADVERARAGCLLANRVWIETRTAFDCVPLPSSPERRESR